MTLKCVAIKVCKVNISCWLNQTINQALPDVYISYIIIDDIDAVKELKTIEWLQRTDLIIKLKTYAVFSADCNSKRICLM